jgi:hypothetical protein
MDGNQERADLRHTMTALLRHQQRAGRFARAVPGGEDVESHATGTPAANDEEPSLIAGYVVDPDAVAEAIIVRLLAGRTIKPRR